MLGAGVAFGLLLWRVLPDPAGDALFHLARVQKLLAFDELSLEGIGEFEDGGLHPGYAFPLWHGFLALVAKIAGVRPELVVEHEAAVLAPLAFLVVYEAGVAVFRSRWLGVATLAGTLGLTALASNAGGAFRSLALPATAGGRQLLVPAAIALVFAYLHERTVGRLVLVACAGLVVAAVHPSYAVFLLLVLAGFAGARVLLVREDLARVAIGVGTFALAAGLFLVWLLPVVQETASFTPSDAQVTGRGHGLERYPRQFIVDSPSSYHLAPIVLTRAGPVPIAALALVPLALLAVRLRWAALVLGGTVALLAVLLLDPVFPRFADAVSLSQARRLAAFLPFVFALAGGAAVLARLLSWAVLPLALGAGILLEWRWPGDFGYVLREGRPDAAGVDRGARRRARARRGRRPAQPADHARAHGLAPCRGVRALRAPARGHDRLGASARARRSSRPGSSRPCASTSDRATSSSPTRKRRTGSRPAHRCTSRSPRRRTSATPRTTNRTSASRSGSASSRPATSRGRTAGW